MPIFNPQVSGLITTAAQLGANLAADTSTGVFKPSPVLENLGVQAIRSYQNDIPLKTYKPKNVPKTTLDPTLYSWQDIAPDKMSKYSNGTFVVGTLKLNSLNDKGKDYTIINANGVLYNSTDNPNPHPELEDLYLDNVILSVTQNKQLVETAIMGHNGKIKEYIGLDDYTVKLEGTLLGANGIYTLAQVTMLQNYLALPASIYVTCPQLNKIFGINYLTVKSSNLDEEAGGISYQKYSITCVSDNLIDSSIMFSPYISGT